MFLLYRFDSDAQILAFVDLMKNLSESRSVI